MPVSGMRLLALPIKSNKTKLNYWTDRGRPQVSPMCFVSLSTSHGLGKPSLSLSLPSPAFAPVMSRQRGVFQ